MSWWKMNESELHPRNRLPVGHAPQSIARVQPMVPEVTLFFPSEEPRPRTPLGDVQNQVLSTQPKVISKDFPPVAPPSKRNERLRPSFNNPETNEFSDRPTYRTSGNASDKNVIRDEFTKPENLPSPEIHRELDDFTKSVDFQKKLEEHTEILKNLQEQMALLVKNEDARLHSQSAAQLRYHDDGQRRSTGSLPARVECSTQTSLPPSPREKRETLSQMRLLDTSTHSEPHLSSASVRDLNDSGSMDLGGSVSYYERLRQTNESRNISILAETANDEENTSVLSVEEVRRLQDDLHALFEASPTLDQSRTPPRQQAGLQQPMNHGEHLVQQPHIVPQWSPVDSMMNRMQQLGVSFVSPDVFSSTSSGYNSYDAQRAVDPCDFSLSNSSLELNSTALKQFDDFQLTHVARKASSQSKKDSPRQELLKQALSSSRPRVTKKPEFVSTYGLGDSNLTMGTKEFLERNRLASSQIGGKSPETEGPMIDVNAKNESYSLDLFS